MYGLFSPSHDQRVIDLLTRPRFMTAHDQELITDTLLDGKCETKTLIKMPSALGNSMEPYRGVMYVTRNVWNRLEQR